MDTDADPDDDQPEPEEATDETPAGHDQSETAETDTKLYHQTDDIDEVIEILAQDNAADSEQKQGEESSYNWRENRDYSVGIKQ